MMNVKDDVKVAKIAKVRERIEDADVSQTGDANPEVNDVNTESEDRQDDQ
jgi:DNA gyrase subunit A